MKEYPTTIVYMFPPHEKNNFKYIFEMKYYGGDQRKELEDWCNQNSIHRRWGNMGYVECNKDEDALYLIQKYGINWKRKKRNEIKPELGYSRIGLNNI